MGGGLFDGECARRRRWVDLELRPCSSCDAGHGWIAKANRLEHANEVGEPERGVEALRKCLGTPDILATALPHAGLRCDRHLTHLVSAGIECCVDHGAPESLEVAREMMNLAVEHVRQTAWTPHMSTALARLHVVLGDEESGRKRLAEAFAADPSLRSEPPGDPQSPALLSGGPPPPARGFQGVDIEEVARLAAAGALRPTSQYDSLGLRRRLVEATVLGWFDFDGGPMCAYQFEAKGRFHLGALRIRKGKSKDKRALSPGEVLGVDHLPEDPRIHHADLKGKPEAFRIADCAARFGPAGAARVERGCALWQPTRPALAAGGFESGPPSPTDEPVALIGLEVGLVLTDRGGNAWSLKQERWTPLEVHPARQGRLIRVGADELLSVTKQGAYAWDGTRWRSESWSAPPDAAACCLGGTVYVFGGATALESACTDGAPPRDDAWAIRRPGTERAPLPQLPGRVVSVGADAGGRVFGWDTEGRMWFVLVETGVDLRTSASASLPGSAVLVCGGGKWSKPRRGAWLVAPDHHRGLLELPPTAESRRPGRNVGEAAGSLRASTGELTNSPDRGLRPQSDDLVVAHPRVLQHASSSLRDLVRLDLTGLGQDLWSALQGRQGGARRESSPGVDHSGDCDHRALGVAWRRRMGRNRCPSPMRDVEIVAVGVVTGGGVTVTARG